MWGIQGSEDLGGGMKANFKLEQDLYTANGNTGASGAGGGVANASGFNRTSLLGVSGGFGSLSFGRDYTPTFKLVAATDVNALSRISTVQNTGANSTVPSLIFYSTPNMSGFQVNVAYGNQDTTTGSSDTSTKTTNLTATYTNGPLMVGAGTGTQEVKAAGAAVGTYIVAGMTFAGIEKTEGTVVAASYDFGKFALKGNMVTTKATAAGGEVKFQELNVGGTMPMGKVTLAAQLGTNKVSMTGAAEDWTGNDFVIGADYALSAKTALFAKTGTYAKVSGNGDDVKSTSTAVGIKTVF
jgi:predicted porin